MERDEDAANSYIPLCTTLDLGTCQVCKRRVSHAHQASSVDSGPRAQREVECRGLRSRA